MKVLDDEARKYLGERFKEMRRKVTIHLFVREGENQDYDELLTNFVSELCEITDKIEARMHGIGDEDSTKWGVIRYPTVLLDPDRYDIRYTGAPVGEEGTAFIQTLIDVSRDDPQVSDDLMEMLMSLEKDVHIEVIVTPTCPYCPYAVLLANRIAIAAPKRVSAECIDATQNMDIAEKYDVVAVPHQMINGAIPLIGVQSEEALVQAILKA